MSIRIIVRTVYTAAAAHVGGPVETEYKTFEVQLPADVEEYLRAERGDFKNREVIGIELL